MTSTITIKDVYAVSDLEKLLPGQAIFVSRGEDVPAVGTYKGKVSQNSFEFIFPDNEEEGIVGLIVNPNNLSFKEGQLVVPKEQKMLVSYLPDDHGYKSMEDLLQQAGLI